MRCQFAAGEPFRLHRHIAPLIRLVEFGSQRHIQLQHAAFGRQDSEAVLAGDEGQSPPVVPFHLKLPGVIYAHKRTLCAGCYRRIGVLHGNQPNAGAGWIFFLQEFHHFFGCKHL